MWKTGHTDLARLLQNSIRWVAGANCAGHGGRRRRDRELRLGDARPGFAVHVLNYTNPAMHRGWIRNFYPIGAQKVTMTLPRAGA